jgi:hypothetical protein
MPKYPDHPPLSIRKMRHMIFKKIWTERYTLPSIPIFNCCFGFTAASAYPHRARIPAFAEAIFNRSQSVLN